ncbi:hypothetical protein [Haladaptatus sp. R4]|uniref:hypothetical protein n=1 Tax=Haladaptatus sp. R4 TaxID=1679489 RepID=UPI000AF01E11|nr:hypothetical protein [Haladaptatus sp. R4]
MSSSDSPVGKGTLPKAIRGREGQLEPFEWYAEMRRDSPVHFNEERRRWDLFRYEEIDRILGDHETFTSDRGVLADDPARASTRAGRYYRR